MNLPPGKYLLIFVSTGARMAVQAQGGQSRTVKTTGNALRGPPQGLTACAQ
jgi:hypothetical protein